jgi:hypothetical protein
MYGSDLKANPKFRSPSSAWSVVFGTRLDSRVKQGYNLISVNETTQIVLFIKEFALRYTSNQFACEVNVGKTLTVFDLFDPRAVRTAYEIYT